MTTLRHYPIFESNQVLTSSQLNDLFTYLDQQNRLTRSALIGIGIVCGLEVTCTEDPVEITISAGVGVTSEGYLIKLKECVTGQFREYVLPGSIDYAPFEDPVTQEQDIQLFELLTDEEAEEAEEVQDLTKEFLTDKVLLLFIECFDQDLKSCLGKSCDELGVQRILSVRKLLITEEQLQTVLERTDGGKTVAESLSREWASFTMPRVFFPKDEPVHYLSYAVAYVQAIRTVFPKIYQAFSETYHDWESYWKPIYGENPFEKPENQTRVTQIENYLTGNVGGIPFWAVQYLYDFMKDLILAYEEFCACACNYLSECCPNPNLFPKHLNLGFVTNGSTDYRNRWTPSPAVAYGSYGSAKVIQYHKRLVALWEQFDPSIMTLKEGTERELKITPSCEKKSVLSKRTIPFYYSGESEEDAISDVWRADNCATEPVLSYTENSMATVPDTPVTTPLRFDTDPYNFYRIEGFIGQHVKEVQGEIAELRGLNQLPFNIELLYLGRALDQLSIPDCLCADLQTTYSVWRNKMLYFLRSWLLLTKRVEQYLPATSKVSETAKDFSFEAKATNTFTTSSATTIANATDETNKFKLDADNWHLSAARAFEFQDIFKTIDPKKDATLSNAASNKPQNVISALISEYNSCLRDLIESMTVGLKQFDKEVWTKHYQCLLYIHIKIMHEATGFVDNRKAQLQIYVVLLIYCALYRLLCFLSIYPYITLGTVMDALQERVRLLQDRLQFNNYCETHPGLEHQAGVPRGGTFFLLYQALSEDRGISEQLREEMDKLKISPDIGLGDLQGTLEEMVIGDFALPYLCCDPCSDLPPGARSLTPLAIPRCDIVRGTINGKYQTVGAGILNYQDVTFRMISHVYDPETFKTQLDPESDGPQFGDVTFESKASPEMPDKQMQMLRYQVDLGKVSQGVAASGEDFFLIDEFSYQVINNAGEVLGASTVTIFIPVIDVVPADDVDVQGSVIVKTEDDVKPPVGQATVTIRSTGQKAISNRFGQFSISAVPVGEQEFVAQRFGFNTAKVDVQVEEGMEPVVIEMTRLTAGGVFVNTGILANELAFRAGSAEANALNLRVKRKLVTNRKNGERIISDTRAVNDLILKNAGEKVAEFSAGGEVDVATMNTDFEAQRNLLIKEIRKTNNPNKDLHTEMLRVLTVSYLDRLAVAEPAGLSDNTKRVLRSTATQLNRNKTVGFGEIFKDWNENNKEILAPKFSAGLASDFKVK